MTVLDSLRAAAAATRAPLAPFFNVQVTIRTRSWATRVDEGSYTDSDLVLPKVYPVKQLSGREVLAAGGALTDEMVRVDGITPPYATSSSSGGYTEAQLDPRRSFAGGTRNKAIMYLLSGDVAGEYALVTLNNSDPVEWSLVLRRTRRTP